jgi:C-terminal processing protease CtpA/Prc
MVLDVIEGSPAEKARIKSGDVILSVRDVPVRTREDLQMHLKEPGNARIVVRDYGGIAVRETVISREEEPIGVITVPQLGDQPIASAGSAGPLGNLFKGLFNRLMG